MKGKKVRVGVVGIGRGGSFARGAGEAVGMELVALCDTWTAKLGSVKKQFAQSGRAITTYTDYDKFLAHDMDAVILANYFHEHAQFAIKALRAGKHVMSETTACMTLGLGVELVETVQKTGMIYMFAENYPYMLFNQEMRKLYQAGKIGRFVYGEGEYVHPISTNEMHALTPGVDHWRAWIPATYYCTHAIAPVMFITDTMPVTVNGFVIPYDRDDPQLTRTLIRHDTASAIMVRMDNDAVVKLLQYHLRGHGNFVRIHGNRGLMENLRCGNQQMLRVHKEPFDKQADESVETIYSPQFPAWAAGAQQAGHGGGDFFMNHEFATAIRTGRQPYLDVFRGVAMSAVGIQAYRSALADGAPMPIPDFRRKAVRDKYRDDHWNPDPTQRKATDPACSVLGDIKPSREALQLARKVWKEKGYDVR